MSENVLEKAAEYIKTAQDFAIQNLPQIVQEAFRYEKTHTWIQAILILVLFFSALTIGYYYFRNPNVDKDGDWTAASSLRVFVCCIAMVPILVSLWVVTENLLKIYFCQKLFLLEIISKIKWKV